jgi:hypothetical protein
MMRAAWPASAGRRGLAVRKSGQKMRLVQLKCPSNRRSLGPCRRGGQRISGRDHDAGPPTIPLSRVGEPGPWPVRFGEPRRRLTGPSWPGQLSARQPIAAIQAPVPPAIVNRLLNYFPLSSLKVSLAWPKQGAEKPPADRQGKRPGSILVQPGLPHSARNLSISTAASAALISTSSAPTSPYSHSMIAESGSHVRSRRMASSIGPSTVDLRRARPDGECAVRPAPTIA